MLVVRLWRRRQAGVDILLDPVRDLLAPRVLLRVVGGRSILGPVPGAAPRAEARPRLASLRGADGGLGPLHDVLPVLRLGDGRRVAEVARAAPATLHVLRRVGDRS